MEGLADSNNFLTMREKLLEFSQRLHPKSSEEGTIEHSQTVDMFSGGPNAVQSISVDLDDDSDNSLGFIDLRKNSLKKTCRLSRVWLASLVFTD